MSFRKHKKTISTFTVYVFALLQACAKQKRGIAFGPRDCRRSFTSLISSGLIVKTSFSPGNNIQSCRLVTKEAISILKSMSIDVAC